MDRPGGMVQRWRGLVFQDNGSTSEERERRQLWQRSHIVPVGWKWTVLGDSAPYYAAPLVSPSATLLREWEKRMEEAEKEPE